MEFRDIPGFVGYQINRNGELRTSSGFSINGCLRDDGYRVTCLTVDGKSKLVRFNRLVAMTFLDNPENLELVDHINGIRDDNRAENLRWASRELNNQNRKNCKNIYWDKSRQKFQAYLTVNHHTLRKRFDSESDAIEWLAKMRLESNHPLQ